MKKCKNCAGTLQRLYLWAVAQTRRAGHAGHWGAQRRRSDDGEGRCEAADDGRMVMSYHGNDGGLAGGWP